MPLFTISSPFSRAPQKREERRGRTGKKIRFSFLYSYSWVTGVTITQDLFPSDYTTSIQQILVLDSP